MLLKCDFAYLHILEIKELGKENTSLLAALWKQWERLHMDADTSLMILFITVASKDYQVKGSLCSVW